MTVGSGVSSYGNRSLSKRKKTAGAVFLLPESPAKALLPGNHFDIRSSNEPAESSCRQRQH